MFQFRASRRKFAKQAVVKAAVGLLGLPVLFHALREGLIATAEAAPNWMPLDDPMAKGLQYVEDGSKSKNPAFKKGSNCKNCALYQEDTAVKDGGKCTLFGGKHVKDAGWCASWSKKA